MSNLIDRYKKERQMETDLRVRTLQIKRLEHMMAYELDPFGPEFEEAAEKLQKLKEDAHIAATKKMIYHQETCRLEDEARRKKQEAENAQREAPWRKNPKLAAMDAKGNQPEI